MKTLPDIRAHFDWVAEHDARARRVQRGFHAQLRAHFQHHIPAGERLLELGCGAGDLLADLSPSRGLGLDFSSAMIAKARRRYADNPALDFRVADVSALEVSEKFDHIVLDYLTGYLPDIHAVLERLQTYAHARTRLHLTSLNTVWKAPLRWATKFGLVMPQRPSAWLSHIARALRQPGKGKWDAVRAGFAVAEGEVLVIQDADLTAPPEDLPKFYQTIAQGAAEFANGSRLVYPMEQRAMRFLNFLGNKFFAAALSFVLGQRVKDSLCGTKMLLRSDYERVLRRIAPFGDFDPFGDFNLLFGAALLNLRIRDVPVRYKDRTYGETNISRFRHGWLFVRMTWFGLWKLRCFKPRPHRGATAERIAS